MRELLVALFATTAGFTASGIIANLYRLMVAEKPKSTPAHTAYIAVMVLAGPTVLFENAAKSLKAKSCSRFAFWLAACISAYWSFAIGLLILNISLAI